LHGLGAWKARGFESEVQSWEKRQTRRRQKHYGGGTDWRTPRRFRLRKDASADKGAMSPAPLLAFSNRLLSAFIAFPVGRVGKCRRERRVGGEKRFPPLCAAFRRLPSLGVLAGTALEVGVFIRELHPFFSSKVL
jgi:hypothetical protein